MDDATVSQRPTSPPPGDISLLTPLAPQPARARVAAVGFIVLLATAQYLLTGGRWTSVLVAAAGITVAVSAIAGHRFAATDVWPEPGSIAGAVCP